MVGPAHMDEGKTFERYADRIYFEDASNAASSRLAFVAARGEQRERLDPLAEWASGCFVSFPPTSDLDTLLAEALRTIDADPKLRLFLVSSKGKRRSEIRTNPDGQVSSGEIQFGDAKPEANESPTGDGKWRLKLETTTLAIWPGQGLQFDFGRNARLAGFYSGSDFHAHAPHDAEWARFEVYGPRAGLWIVPVMLDQAKLAGLGVGTAFFESTGTISFRKRAYPLFDLEGGEERFMLELNCADPYHSGAARTCLVLPNKPLRAAFNDVNGRTIALVSDLGLGDWGRIVLAPAPISVECGKITSLTHQLVPEGMFKVAGLALADKALSISLGSSNLETLTVPADAGSATIRFAPGPALVDNGPFKFNDDLNFATAWIEVDAGFVDTQPLAIDAEGMQPYAFLADNNVTEGGMAFRPTRPSLRAQRIPFAPVLGLEAGEEKLKYDREVLSKARRARLVGKSPLALKSEGVDELRTPQGYFARRSAAGFEQILFTRTQPRHNDQRKLLDAGAVTDFGLIPRSAEGRRILAELTANSRFFLATRFDRLLKHFEPASLAQIYMAGWRVDRVPEAGQATDRNFIILKCDERSVEQLLQRPDQWLQVKELELSAPEIEALRKEVGEVIRKAPVNALYRPLAERMQSTTWRGLVCIGMELGEMPDQLGALETLVDSLPVHHVGVDLTAIETDTTRWRASIFGLIDKDKSSDFSPKDASQTDPGKDPPPMQLQLAELKLLVENDAVKNFSCKVNARVGTIFRTRLDKALGGNHFTLEGIYQSRVNPKGERQDSYSFAIQRVNGTAPLFRFSPDTFVLEEVTLTRAELVTIIEQDSAGKRRKNGMLLLDGWLKFGEIGKARLFAIDRLEFAALGVKFGKLSSGLDFDLRFEFPSLRFDFAKFNRLHGVKDGSLLGALPFRLSGFRIGDLSLGELDYFDFGSLGDDLPALKDFKLALDFDLDLGSLGSLGKKLEHFKLNFLIGWDPDVLSKLASGVRIDTGDGGGALDVGIEGIIKLTAKHFHIGKAEDGSGRYILALDEARLKLFSVELPKDDNQRFSLYLLGDPKSGAFTDKIAWYGVFNDQDGTDGPVSIKHLALGQRIEITQGGKPISGIRTTSQVLSTIQGLQSFDGPDADQKFLQFAKSDLRHEPQRGWFAALQGSFFELFDLQLLLRDPDMYGIYVKLLADDLSIDLLYQKLAEGVGLYSGELDLRKLVGQIDFGAVSVTLGIIGFEVYTDGGFLIDLGFPEHVDYSRSFVAQAGIFIGKGGFYIGRTPGRAVPAFGEMGDQVGNAFRMGLALRLGLGREFQKGPLYASLSVSVFGRVEGAVAERKQLLVAEERTKSKALAKRETSLARGSYVFFLQGEIGIILEIEGRVDLRLVQARVLVRAWIAAGITLITGRPIILHAEAGVRVKVRVVIGKIKIFRKTIKIYVTLSYSTTLRYEWELKGGPRMRLLAFAPWSWIAPQDSKTTFANVPVRLRLSLEITREAAGRAVMVPMATLMVVKDAAQNPLAALAQGMILWALGDADQDPIFHRFSTENGEPTIAVLSARLKTFSSQPDAWIEAFLSQVLGGSTVELAATDTDDDRDLLAGEDAWSFPLPPGLAFTLAGKDHDLAQQQKVTEAQVDAIADEIAAQFALQNPTAAERLDVGAARPFVDHIFRNWLETLALNTVDAMQNAWMPDPESQDYAAIRMRTLMDSLDWKIWDGIAGRTGRYLFGGIRVSDEKDNKQTVPLFGRAGFMFPIPKSEFAFELKDRNVGWLRQIPGTLTIKGALAAGIADVTPQIDSRREPNSPSATQLVPRVFSLPDVEPLTGSQHGPALVHFTEDLRRQLSLAPAEGEGSPIGRLGLLRRETKHDGAAEPMPAHFATLFDLLVQVPAAQQSKTRSLAARNGAVLEVLGTSEAQRKPLDALFPCGVPDPALRHASLQLAIHRSEARGYELIDGSAGLKVARATTNRERRPGEDARAFAGSADDSFLAEATDVPGFLQLLRRAAIVNAGGTYLLFEHLADDLHEYFGSTGARLSVLLVFPEDRNTALPGKAINAAVLGALLGAAKRLVAMATDSYLGVNDRFFESAAVREPGAELFRFWRKAPKDDDQSTDTPTDDDKREYLARLFDMLEFGVAGAGTPLTIDRSLPLASELVSKVAKERTEEQPYTAAQLADLMIPQDADEWLKYDLLVPLWRWAPAGEHQQPGDRPNPYNALLQPAYRIEYGWRDIFGNRLEATESFTYQPRYSDPLDPPAAWPAVAGRFRLGTALGTVELYLIDTSAEAGLEATERERALWRAIHQLEGPRVGARIASRFGALKPPRDLDTPEKFALALAKALRTFLKPGPPPVSWTFQVTPQTEAPHAPLDLALTIERAASYCTPGCPHDVRTVESPIALVARTPVEGEETSPARRLASEFAQAFPGHMLARGTADDGSSQWWAVDRRIVRLQARAPLEVYAQPPLALASVSARDVDLTVFERSGQGGWSTRLRTVDVPEVDSDALFGDFLDKLERFVGPAMAGHTALQSESFNRVMRAKHSMLGPREDAGGLFREVRNVNAQNDEMGPLAGPARRLLRQACGNDFRAFYNVAVVLVRPLEFSPDVPEHWFGEGEAAHKLHGRFVLGANDQHLRLSTFGIPLSGRTSAIAVAFDAPPGQSEWIKLQDRLAFEITHIEREVDPQRSGADTMPAASSWLQLIAPEGSDNGLPRVQLTEESQAIPVPSRTLPAPPALSEPQPEKASAPVTGTGYAAEIVRICSWQYRFKLNGLMGTTGLTGDEACCRLVYNVDPGANRIDTQTAAQPLFPNLGHALAKYKEEGDGLWSVLNEPEASLFAAACREFATVAEAIAGAIAIGPARLSAGLPPAEDRFVIQRLQEQRVRFRFENHLADSARPDANPFEQLAKGRRCVIGKDNSKWKPLDQGPQDFASSGDDLIVGIDGMRVQDRRSVWAAASIRRNSELHWRFVYRTAEIYLQEPVVPFLQERRTIPLGARGAETLAARLAAALHPILATQKGTQSGAELSFPLQLRLGIEPRRLAERFTDATLPEPAPKVQLICQASADEELVIATRLATLFLDQLAGESLGSPDDAWLILSLLLLTEERQPLLDIPRIAVSIENLTFSN